MGVACSRSSAPVSRSYCRLFSYFALSRRRRRRKMSYLYRARSSVIKSAKKLLFLYFEIKRKKPLPRIDRCQHFGAKTHCLLPLARQTNSQTLITCPDSKSIVPLEALVRCSSSEVGFLCPKNVLKSISSLKRLGFASNAELKMSFSRNHMPASTAVNIYNLLFILADLFLSPSDGRMDM